MISIDISPISLLFLLFALVYLFGLLYVAILERRRPHEEGESTVHLFSLIVPAHNEENVIAGCLDSLLRLDYPENQVEVLVVDDGSTDSTARIVDRVAERLPGKVGILQVPVDESGRGKARALNRGFRHLVSTSRFRNQRDWIIGVFDADGLPDSNMLKKASYQFNSSTVAGVQSSVRIRNRDTSWLTRMQDIEFAGFSRITQIIRMRISSSAALGGNGQFVRASALKEVAVNAPAGLYWDSDSLTEDLDLSSRLVLRNFDLRHLSTSCVWQEGVETFQSLMKQRTRWAWGSLQVFRQYVLGLKVLTVPNVRLLKRLDLLFNLSVFLVSPLILVTWIVSAVAFIGLIGVLYTFPGTMMLGLSFAYLPLVAYGLATVRGYRRLAIPLDLLGFALYTYHWVPCLYVGIWHVVAGHGPVWWKTVRKGETASG